MEYKYKIRPHHGMCIAFFKGKGYSEKFTAHMKDIIKELENQSHIDGSRHLFTPENVVDIQRTIGADIVMAFDECTPGTADYDYARLSMERTHRWLARGYGHFLETEPKYGYSQTFFPIVQGCVYEDLRRQSAEFVRGFDAEGYAIGGLAVGEPTEKIYEMVELINGI